MTTSGTTPAQSIDVDVTTPEGIERAAERLVYLTGEIASLERRKKELDAMRKQISMRLLGQAVDKKEAPTPVMEEGRSIRIGLDLYRFKVGKRTVPAYQRAWDAIYRTLPAGSPEQERMDTAKDNSMSTTYTAIFERCAG